MTRLTSQSERDEEKLIRSSPLAHLAGRSLFWMPSLVDLTKYVVARIYPALVWGTLMGFAVHAGLNLHFLNNRYERVESEPVALNYDVASSVPTTVRFTESTPARTAALP